MGYVPTVIFRWAAVIIAALEAKGFDCKPLLAEVGLDASVVSNPDVRVPVEVTTKLWKKGVELTGDPCLGISASLYVNHCTFHALGYTVLASSTLKEVFERIERYCRTVTDAGVAELKELPDCFKLVVSIPPGQVQPAEEAIDAFLSLMVRVGRLLLVDRGFAPLRVTVKRAQPEKMEGYHRFYKAPIEFSTNENSLFFTKSALQVSLATANEELGRRNEQLVQEYLSRFDKENVTFRVKQTIMQLLHNGEPSQEVVAEKLHMSTRNLQRKLSRENATYKDILDNVRKELALSYVRSSHINFGEITYLLGFCDSSSFSRAFKRWTNYSPTEFRSTLQNGNP